MTLTGPGQELAPLTQVELGAVPMEHRTLVHVSCLLVAISFQWGTHHQPGEDERMSKDTNRDPFQAEDKVCWVMAGKGGKERIWGRSWGHPQTST